MRRNNIAIFNGLWNGLANVVTIVAGVLGSVLIVRGLNPDEYGLFSYFAWLAGTITAISTLSLPQALTKIASELRGRGEEAEARALGNLITLLLLGLNGLASGVLVLVALLVPAPTRHYLLVIAAVPLFNALMRVINSVLWGNEQYRPTALVAIGASAIQLALIVITFVRGWGIVGYLAGIVSVNVTGGIILAFVYLSDPDMRKAIHRATFPTRSTLVSYWQYLLPSMLLLFVDIVVAQRSEVFFLERFSTLEQIGYYSMGFTFFAMILGLGQALMGGFYPTLSREYGAGDWAGISAKLGQGVLVVTAFALPLLLGSWATLDGLIRLLYTEKMLPAVPMTQVLFLNTIIALSANAFYLIASTSGRVWSLVRIGAAMAGLNIALDLLLIPRFGAMGAAVAYTLIQLGYAVLIIRVVTRMVTVSLPWRAITIILALAAATTYLLPRGLRLVFVGDLALIPIIVLSAALYALALWSIGLLEPLGIRRPALFSRRTEPVPPREAD